MMMSIMTIMIVPKLMKGNVVSLNLTLITVDLILPMFKIYQDDLRYINNLVPDNALDQEKFNLGLNLLPKNHPVTIQGDQKQDSSRDQDSHFNLLSFQILPPDVLLVTP